VAGSCATSWRGESGHPRDRKGAPLAKLELCKRGVTPCPAHAILALFTIWVSKVSVGLALTQYCSLLVSTLLH